MRPFHFSEDPAIGTFVPRPVAVPSPRPPGQDWLNGPLVWAVGEWRQATYLFPRDCPRILLWPTAETSPADRRAWWGDGTWAMIAYVERGWRERIRTTTLHRYELPGEDFEPLTGDGWMWVSRRPVVPVGREAIDDLPSALEADGVELRVVDRLVELKDVWSTTLHASGIRLRNAEGWPAPSAAGDG